MLSEDASSVPLPVLEEIVGLKSIQIRAFFEAHGFVLWERDKVRTDSLSIGWATAASRAADGWRDAVSKPVSGNGGIRSLVFVAAACLWVAMGWRSESCRWWQQR